MKNVMEAIDARFPCRPAVKFLAPHRRLNYTAAEGTLDFSSLVDMYNYIEVPYEIVKHIYEAGWADAQRAAIEALSNCTQE